MRVLASLVLLLAGLRVGAAQDLEAGIRLYERGEFQQAVDFFLPVTRAFPDSGDLRLWLAKSYLKLQKWDDAVRELERAVRINPANGMYHLWLGRAYGRKAEHVSFVSAFGWARKTLREFEIAVMVAPDNIGARFDLLEFYLEAPGIVGGGRDKAESQAREIARLSPRLGYAARARLLKKEKKWEAAAQELIRATVNFPREPESFGDLAEFQLERADYAAAAESARRGLALNRNLARARLVSAAAQAKLADNLPRAVDMLKGLAQGPLTDDDPPFQTVYYWLGQAYLAQGQKLLAREAFEKALRFDPDCAKARSGLSATR